MPAQTKNVSISSVFTTTDHIIDNGRKRYIILANKAILLLLKSFFPIRNMKIQIPIFANNGSNLI